MTEMNLTNLAEKDIIDNDINQFLLPLQKQRYMRCLRCVIKQHVNRVQTSNT